MIKIQHRIRIGDPRLPVVGVVRVARVGDNLTVLSRHNEAFFNDPDTTYSLLEISAPEFGDQVPSGLHVNRPIPDLDKGTTLEPSLYARNHLEGGGIAQFGNHPNTASESWSTHVFTDNPHLDPQKYPGPESPISLGGHRIKDRPLGASISFVRERYDKFDVPFAWEAWEDRAPAAWRLNVGDSASYRGARDWTSSPGYTIDPVTTGKYASEPFGETPGAVRLRRTPLQKIIGASPSLQRSLGMLEEKTVRELKDLGIRPEYEPLDHRARALLRAADEANEPAPKADDTAPTADGTGQEWKGVSQGDGVHEHDLNLAELFAGLRDLVAQFAKDTPDLVDLVSKEVEALSEANSDDDAEEDKTSGNAEADDSWRWEVAQVSPGTYVGTLASPPPIWALDVGPLVKSKLGSLTMEEPGFRIRIDEGSRNFTAPTDLLGGEMKEKDENTSIPEPLGTADRAPAWEELRDYMSGGDYAKALLRAGVAPSASLDRLDRGAQSRVAVQLRDWAWGALDEAKARGDAIANLTDDADEHTRKLNAWLLGGDPERPSPLVEARSGANHPARAGVLALLQNENVTRPEESAVLSAIVLGNAPDHLVAPRDKALLLWAVNLATGCEPERHSEHWTPPKVGRTFARGAVREANRSIMELVPGEDLKRVGSQLPLDDRQTVGAAARLTRMVDPDSYYRPKDHSLIIGGVSGNHQAPRQVSFAEISGGGEKFLMANDDIQRAEIGPRSYERTLQLGRLDLIAEWADADPRGLLSHFSNAQELLGGLGDPLVLRELNQEQLARLRMIAGLVTSPRWINSHIQDAIARLTSNEASSIPLLPKDEAELEKVYRAYLERLGSGLTKMEMIVGHPGADPDRGTAGNFRRLRAGLRVVRGAEALREADNALPAGDYEDILATGAWWKDDGRDLDEDTFILGRILEARVPFETPAALTGTRKAYLDMLFKVLSGGAPVAAIPSEEVTQPQIEVAQTRAISAEEVRESWRAAMGSESGPETRLAVRSAVSEERRKEIAALVQAALPTKTPAAPAAPSGLGTWLLTAALSAAAQLATPDSTRNRLPGKPADPLLPPGRGPTNGQNG